MRDRPMMKCGHAANGTKTSFNASNDGPAFPSIPCCVICAPSKEAYEIDENPPDLRNRKARCDCGKEVPSSFHLPFFEFRGPGSRFARDLDPDGLPYDDYYCGHAGFD